MGGCRYERNILWVCGEGDRMHCMDLFDYLVVYGCRRRLGGGGDCLLCDVSWCFGAMVCVLMSIYLLVRVWYRGIV